MAANNTKHHQQQRTISVGGSRLRLDFQAGAGQAAVDQVGPVLDLLQLALDDADQAGLVGGGEVGDRPLEQRPDALIRSQPADVTTRSLRVHSG